MKKREILFVFITAIIILIIVIMPSVLSIYGINKGTVSELALYNDGWYYAKENGKEVIYHDVTPENYGRWLLMTISGYGVKAYADGRLIYESEYMASPKYGKVPTAGNNYIQIPEGAEQIALEFTCPYKGYNRRLPTIYIGDNEVDLLYLNHTLYQFHQVMDLLIMMYGALLILYALYHHMSMREKFAADLYLGLLLVTVGLWLRWGTFDVEIRRVSKEILYHASYQLWYAIPVLICGFLKHYFKEKNKKYRIMQIVFFMCAVIIQVLRNCGIAEYVESVFITYMELAVISIAVLRDVASDEIRQWRTKHMCNFNFVGMLVLILFSAIELISYFLTMQSIGIFIRIGIIFFMSLLAVNEVKERERREIKILENMAEQKELQMKIMLSQLQPHFVFNALGAIRLMIHVDSDAAYDMIHDFSQFIRLSIHAIQTDKMIPFADELAQIKAYMNIESKRFNNCVKAEYDIKTVDFMLPALTVQPLVAGIIMHGIRKNGDGGTVTVRTYRDEPYVTVQVEDNVGMMDMDMLQTMMDKSCTVDTGQPDFYMSFANVKHRLELQKAAEIVAMCEPGKYTCIKIMIPLTADLYEVKGNENNSGR